MLKCLYIFIFFFTQTAWAETSFFKKLTLLRFGPEEFAWFDNGSLDLSKLENTRYFHAHGPVYFVPGELLEPRFLSTEEFQALPHISADLRSKLRPGPMPGTQATFGTFVLHFRGYKGQRLSFDFPRLFHPMEVHYVDATKKVRLLVHEEINPDPARNRNIGGTRTPSVVDASADFYLFAKVSGPQIQGENSLSLTTFYLGEEMLVLKIGGYERVYASIISGSFLVIFVFYFFIFLFRTNDKSSLVLCLYAGSCFCLSLLHIGSFDLDNFQILTLFTFLNLVSIVFMQIYIYEKIDQMLSIRWRRSLLTIGIGILLMITLGIVTETHRIVQLFFIADFAGAGLLIIFAGYWGLKHRISGMRFFVVGAAFALAFHYPIIANFGDSLTSENGYNIILAHFTIALSLALVNAKDFAVTFHKTLTQGTLLEERNREISYFNRNLERLVDSKTHEVRSLLDHIPQGVLSLNRSGEIAESYSAHLVHILGQRDFAGRTFKATVLDRCQLSADAADQIWQSVLACLGEDPINFEMNFEKMPTELVYLDGQRELMLRVTWNIEVEDNRIERILITLLDASSEYELQRESTKQRREIVQIQELLENGSSKVGQFFANSTPLLQECETILSKEADIPLSTLRVLFINAHTIKGGARTLQLRELASQIHTMESYYSDIIKNQQPLDRQRITDDFKKTMAVYQSYVDINRNKLNRTDRSTKITLEREYIELQYQQIENILARPDEPTHAFKHLTSLHRNLKRFIFEQLPKVFDDYKARATAIAKDLGKSPPRFDIDVEEVAIFPAERSVLDRCMLHILRNALDHGIEDDNERLEKGKPKEGTIFVKAFLKGAFLQFIVEDDGRGLDMGNLRERVAYKNLNDQDIANTILQPGVSTSKGVSEISGRGIGLDAVHAFLKKAGGDISISLGSPKDASGRFHGFRLEFYFKLSPGFERSETVLTALKKSS